MERGLDFLFLGPLEVRDDGRPLHLGGVRQRSVLAHAPAPRGRGRAGGHADRRAVGRRPAGRRRLRAAAARLAAAPAARARTPSSRPSRPATACARRRAAPTSRASRALRAEGRDHLAAGRAEAAAEALRAALGQWRGRALADLAHEQCAVAAVEALEEERLEALELRVDADLALGRHADWSAELRTLGRAPPAAGAAARAARARAVPLPAAGRGARGLRRCAAHPGRRARARAGPRAAPAAAGRAAPRAGAGAAARARASPRGARRGGGSRGSPLPAVAAIAVAGAAAAFATRGDEPAGPPARAAATGGELVAIDAGDRAASCAGSPPGGRPAALARTGDGRLWAVDADARTLLAVDPATGTVETLATGGHADRRRRGRARRVGGRRRAGRGRAVRRAGDHGGAPARGAPTRTVRATRRAPAHGRAGEQHGREPARRLGARGLGRRAVRRRWCGSTRRRRRRPAGRGAPARSPSRPRASDVWALRPDGVVLALDEATGARARAGSALPTDAPARLAAGRGAGLGHRAARRAPVPGRRRDGRAVRAPRSTSALRRGRGGGRTGRGVGGRTRSPARSSRSTSEGRASCGPSASAACPRALLVADGTVWAAMAGGRTAAAATRRIVAGVRPAAARRCASPRSPAPANRADVLIVSDLPLQGGIRITATQMAQAIAFVLRERGFRAGRFRVAYQSCDDSVARTGLFDEAKCAANARAYGARPEVVAVIGTLNSPCAVAALPHLNRAPGGPVADGLAAQLLRRADPSGAGRRPGRCPSALYPAGVPLVPPGLPHGRPAGRGARAPRAVTAAADTVFVLDDGEPGYGALLADGFATGAERLGLRVAGPRALGPAGARLPRRSPGASPRRGPRRSSSAGCSTRTRRGSSATCGRRSGRRPDLMGPDGLAPLGAARASRPAPPPTACSSAYAGVLMDGLPPAGAAFARRFAEHAAGPAGGARPRSTPRRPPRWCSTRSPAPTGPARRCSTPSSRRASGAGCSATSPSSASGRHHGEPGHRAPRRTRRRRQARSSRAAPSSASLRPPARLVG